MRSKELRNHLVRKVYDELFKDENLGAVIDGIKKFYQQEKFMEEMDNEDNLAIIDRYGRKIK